MAFQSNKIMRKFQRLPWMLHRKDCKITLIQPQIAHLSPYILENTGIPFVKKMVEYITIFCILYYFVYRIFFPFPMSWTFLVEIGILLLYIYHVRLSLVYHFSSFLRRIYEFSLPFILVSEKVLKPQFSLTSIILH